MIRLVNRLLALLLGAVLLAGGVLVIIEAIWTWTGNGFVWIDGHAWLSAFKTTEWSAPTTIAICIAAGVLGLILFLGELKPQRKRVIEYRTDRAGHWQLLRRSTEAHLRRRISAQVPTTPIKARLKPGKIRWSLALKARAAASTRPNLEAAGRAELALLHAPDSSVVRVRTTGSKKTPAKAAADG